MCDEGCHQLSADEVNGRWEKFWELMEVVGLDLLAGLMRLKEESKRKHMLEELAAEGDEAAAQEWWERYGDGEGRKAEDGGRKTESNGQRETGERGVVSGELKDERNRQPAIGNGKIRVIREGESLEYGGKTYVFGGGKRWKNIAVLMGGEGKYVKCDKGLKGLFTSNLEANAFFEAAIEAQAPGRKGTGCYKLK